ncbi:hypothetical protein HYALB_00011900, partial [Hymenoscyphus albidus]
TPGFQHIQIKKLHPTFGAEVSGVDFSKEIPSEIFDEILEALIKYAVCVYRDTGLDDRRHVEFSTRFGELDDIKPYLTKEGIQAESFDMNTSSCLTQEMLTTKEKSWHQMIQDHSTAKYFPCHVSRCQMSKLPQRAILLFHVDSSFNPRRASYSLLRGVILPPPETGGNIDFADTRTAYDELPKSTKEKLLKEDYVVAHSFHHSRKIAAPEFFKDLDPRSIKMSKHKLLQVHEPSGRMNLYIASHAHHIEGLPKEQSDSLLRELMVHCTQGKYTFSVQWRQPGDLIIWDNTCCLHRSGAIEGGYVRDMRRTTVHDGSSMAWGMNREGERKQGFTVGRMGMMPERESWVEKDKVVV